MSRTSFRAILLAVVGIAACDALEPTPSNPFGNASIAEMRAELGTYTVTEIPVNSNQLARGPNENGAVLLFPYPRGVTATQIWQNGTITGLVSPAHKFSGTAMNNLGDVVGIEDSVVAVWKAGANLPAHLFPQDQDAFASKVEPFGINDRGEILIRNMTSLCEGHGVWRDGEFKTISASRPSQINNQGMILADTCNFLYDTWTLSASPFGANPVNSGKLAGRACDYDSVHGRLASGRFLNDSNEVIDSDNAWSAQGCVKLGRNAIAMNSRGVLIVYPDVYQCGAGSCDVSVELMTTEGRIPLDSLLGPASAEYRVAGASGINDAGQILGYVIRKSDNARLTVFLSPQH
jgi:hypothetical protein